ncbi:hypothetical protein AAFF_G00410340 [Aldrovandia affinis]|uniref:C2H2-type domain-containing protein n=1 Tax=Aldrovandia affinis TaxID=143900 RepID=A0AAD7SC70_9TELE|nr:hypothetical protein AAFF_G00410340 [Aldrovandia affinis]
MAEEESDLESERFKEQLRSLLNCVSGEERGSQSKNYCTRFCELVEDQTGRWQVPLPQLQVLRTAFCYFTHDTVDFPFDCEHVRYALSSLALSFFELLLFFGKDEFLEDPLKDILESFQECHSCLVRHKNVYLLLLKQIIKDGGPWENTVLQAILRETTPPREEVESYLSMEVPVFFELRVRYLLACERIQEAVALAKSCIEHPEVGRHLYFHQAYLTCLLKASLFDHLHKEIAEIDGKDAVEIICNSENEERDDLLLALCKAFLTQQLQNGNMYYIWDLIFIWSKLHLRANPSKQDFLEECHQLMLSATNVKSIFPFMKVIRAELGNEGLQFCVELCARALQIELHHDPATKLLIYKTIAFLLPNDLEVCRACALLVFFLERTVESYKMVYLLYTHPDQEYEDYSLVKNHIRFEILQILKKGLFFDPEFWNLITLRTNCLKLMSEKVMQAALSEMMEEDKWIPNYCVKEPSKFFSDAPDCHTNQLRRHPVKKPNRSVIKRIVVPPEVVGVSLVKRRGRKPGSRVIRVMDDSQLRRSFRQLDMAQENSVRQHDNRQQRLLARQGEKKTLKRRGRKPHWLLQEIAKQAENSAPRHIGRPGRKKQLPPNMESKLPDHSTVQTDKDADKAQEVSIEETNSDVELTPPLPAPETANEETVQLQEQVLPLLSVTLPDDPLLTAVPVTMLEVTISDNEVVDMFSEEQVVEIQQLADIVEQEYTVGDGVDIREVAAEEHFAESCDRKEETPIEPPGDSALCALPSEAIDKVCQESVVEVDNDVIQQLHNYSRIPEEAAEENVPSSVSVPEELPSAPQQCISKNTEVVEEPPVEVCEHFAVEKVIPSQIPAGMGSSSEVDVVEPGSMPEAIEEVPETVGHQEAIQADEGYVNPEATVRDEISVPDDKTAVPNDVSSVHQHTICALDKIVTACIGNPEIMTAMIDDVVDNGSVSDIMTAVPDDATVPINCVLNDTVAQPDSAPETPQDLGLPLVLSQTKDMEPEKDSSEPVPVAMPDILPKKALKYRCKLCNKEFKGGNIMRHAVSHLQKDTRKCMFCGKLFNRPLFARKHLEVHIEKLRLEDNPRILAPENVTPETLECARRSLSRSAKHRREPAADAEKTVPSDDGKFNNKLKVLQRLKKVKDSNSVKEKTATVKSNGTIVEGELERGKREYLCPADGCSKTFVRRGTSMIRHAVASHPSDAKVQEFAFRWRKGKCEFCQRTFWSFQHYQDHIKRHDHPLKHVCLHLDCKNRFKSRAELRGHLKSHQPLKAQCSFAGCSEIFYRLSQLQDHEWRHYPVPDTGDDSVQKVQTHQEVGKSVRWKRKDSQHVSGRRLKVRKESTKLDEAAVPDVSSTDCKAVTNATKINVENKAVSETSTVEKTLATGHVMSPEGSGSDTQFVNGHDENIILEQTVTKTISTQDISQDTRVEINDVDKKKEPEGLANHQEPIVQGQKRVKEEVERSAYGGTSNRPFVRPPPSAYLDERYISMPKRRKSSPADSHCPVGQSDPSGKAQRRRCSKCFSSFDSVEALQSHLSLNKCTSLFGFDSDEESAC